MGGTSMTQNVRAISLELQAQPLLQLLSHRGKSANGDWPVWPPERHEDFPLRTPRSGLLQQKCIPDFGGQGISLDFPLFGTAHRDFLFRPVDVFKTHPTDFAYAQAVDRAKQDRAATSDLNWRRTVDTGKKLSHLFPRRALRQIFVGVKPGRIDGFGDACGAPTSTAGIAKERAQRLYMERHASSLPPAGNSAGEVFGDGHR